MALQFTDNETLEAASRLPAEHRGYALPGDESYWTFSADNFAKAGIDLRRFQDYTEAAHRKFHRLIRATS